MSPSAALSLLDDAKYRLRRAALHLDPWRSQSFRLYLPKSAPQLLAKRLEGFFAQQAEHDPVDFRTPL